MLQFEQGGQRGQINKPEIFMDARLNSVLSDPTVNLRVIVLLNIKE